MWFFVGFFYLTDNNSCFYLFKFWKIDMALKNGEPNVIKKEKKIPKVYGIC